MTTDGAIERIVIVGANLAGGRAAEALREAGFEGRVTLVGEEEDRPYERPPLSKDVLRAETDPQQTYLRDGSWYEENDIELRLGAHATALDPSGSLELDGGEEISFDRCLLATGGRVRRLEVEGSALEGVRYLRTLSDATSLADELSRRPRLVVVGAGFIGAEVAASARMVGCEVTVLEIADVPLAHVLGEDIGRIYADIHRDHGVDLRLGEGIASFEGDGHVEAVVSSDGARLAADLVVVGVGISPNDELASAAGISCTDGVLVDERCRTSAERVYAAGDVARWPDGYSGERIRVEHFQNAQNQGPHAARAMLGSEEPYADLPWFWSDQYEVNLQMIGRPSDELDRVVRGSTDARAFTAFFSDGKRVRAAIAINRPKDIAAARRLITRGIDVDPSDLADEDVSLRDLVKGR